MKNPTAALRSTRVATLIGGTAALLIAAVGIAGAASYPGLDRAGGIHACFSQSATRIVDHFPCKTGETPLSWNAQGRAGTDGADGLPGTDGKDGGGGTPGKDGGPGKDGRDGTNGTDGHDGGVGATGPVGPPADPIPGPQGPRGDVGPAGPQGAPATGGGASLMSGRIVNNTDPDCAMTAAMGHTTAGACSMTPLKALGDMLASPATVSSFTAVFDRAQTGGHIYAITIDPTTARAVDVLLLCTIPAGTATCDQTAAINLSGRTLLGLEFDGDRSWTSVTFGYQMSPR